MPNLQSAALMGIVGFVPNPKENIWHCVNKLETWYLTWEQVHSVNAWSQPSHLSHVSVSALLYGFFEFYSCRFPRGTFSVSIKDGVIQKQKILSKKARLFLSIEDPFETYDSHCPHDLSIPASESGTRDMLEFFRAAEMHLRQILLGKSQHEKLWPEHSIVSNESIQKIQTKPNFKRFANDGGLGRGHGGGRRGGRGLYDHNRKGRGRPSPKPTATDAEKHESKQADSKIFTVGQPVETQTGPKPAVASKSTNVRKKKNNTNNKGDGTVRRKGVDPSSHTADRAGPRVPESSKPKHNNRPRKRPTKKDVGEPP